MNRASTSQCICHFSNQKSWKIEGEARQKLDNDHNRNLCLVARRISPEQPLEGEINNFTVIKPLNRIQVYLLHQEIPNRSLLIYRVDEGDVSYIIVLFPRQESIYHNFSNKLYYHRLLTIINRRRSVMHSRRQQTFLPVSTEHVSIVYGQGLILRNKLIASK